MSKKNKKRFEGENSQYADLKALNKMIDSGIIPESMKELNDEKSGDDMLDDLYQNMLKEKNSGVKTEQQHEESSSTPSHPIRYSDIAKQFTPPSKKEERDASKTNYANELKITFSADLFKCLTFNDGVKSISIDLNALQHNEEYDNLTVDEVYAMSMIRLTEVLTNFYPSAILTRKKYENMVSKVKSVDTDYFHMFEYPDFSNELLLGYFIRRDSLNAYSTAINEAGNMKCLYQLLNMLLQLTDALGFSFKNLPSSVVKQLTLTDEFNNLTKAFEKEFLAKKNGTVLNDNPNEAIDEDDIPSILPFDYSCPGLIPGLDDDLSEESDSEEYDDEYEDSENSDEDMSETPEDSDEDGVSGLLDELEESDNVQDEETDSVPEPDEGEYEKFMSNREKVQQRQEQKREKAPQKKSGDDDYNIKVV